VAVVDTEAVKHSRKRRNVFGHVSPEPRVVFRSATVVKLDAVAPDDNFTPKVCLGGKESEVLERICVPNPTVVGEGESSRVVFLGYIVGRKPRKVGFNERQTRVRLVTHSTRNKASLRLGNRSEFGTVFVQPSITHTTPDMIKCDLGILLPLGIAIDVKNIAHFSPRFSESRGVGQV